MLVGRDPIIATEMQPDTIERALPSGVSDAARMAIESAMAYNKADRTPSVRQFIMEINPTAEGTAVVSKPILGPVEGKKTKPITPAGQAKLTKVIKKDEIIARKKKIGIIALAVVAVLELVCIGIYFFENRRPLKTETDAFKDEYIEELYNQYKADCDKCDSLTDVTDIGDYDALWSVKNLLKSIESVEQSSEAQHSDYGFNLLKKRGIADRLNTKLQQASWAWKAAGDAQMDLCDNQQALDYYQKANELFPSDSLAYLIKYNKNMVELQSQEKSDISL